MAMVMGFGNRCHGIQVKHMVQ